MHLATIILVLLGFPNLVTNCYMRCVLRLKVSIVTLSKAGQGYEMDPALGSMLLDRTRNRVQCNTDAHQHLCKQVTGNNLQKRHKKKGSLIAIE